MNSTFHPCDLPLKNSEPQPKHKKNITRQIPIEAPSTVSLMSMPQNHQGHQQPSLRNCHEKSKGGMTPQCNVESWMRSWNRKRTLSKN